MSDAWSRLKTNYIAELEQQIEELRAKIDRADSTGQPTKALTLMLNELVERLSYLKTDVPG
jgi:hypothetical protein